MGSAIIFNVLMKKEAAEYIAHCLELDIVATGGTPSAAKKDMLDLIRAQVEYAFAHDNLEHLYRPAPAETWKEFYACKAQEDEKISLRAPEGSGPRRFVPPWIIARTCTAAHA